MKFMWFISGVALGCTTLTLALANVPAPHSVVTDDTAIYQKLSDIRVSKEGKVDVDAELSRLESEESRFRENLPSAHPVARLRAPMQRIAAQKYKPSRYQV